MTSRKFDKNQKGSWEPPIGPEDAIRGRKSGSIGPLNDRCSIGPLNDRCSIYFPLNALHR